MNKTTANVVCTGCHQPIELGIVYYWALGGP